MSWAEFAHPKHAHAVSQRDPDFAPAYTRPRRTPHKHKTKGKGRSRPRSRGERLTESTTR
jgi:hypothetical protein